MSLRILHIDDDADMRDIVGLSLALDPALTVTSCANGREALAIAAEEAPDLVLCDVMMPGMDGPTVLAHLRESSMTAKTALIFMTAVTAPHEVKRLTALGAAAVIAKPFDPMTLADMVRSKVYAMQMDAVRSSFATRMRSDATLLTKYRKILQDDPGAIVLPDGLESCVHKLSGAAGVFNLETVSRAASTVETAIAERRAGRATLGTIKDDLDALLECIDQATERPVGDH
jgi:two-component system OmpR family response regulator